MGHDRIVVQEFEIDDAMDRAAEAIRDQEAWIERVEVEPEKAREFRSITGWVCIGILTGFGDGGMRSWWVMLNPFTGEGRLRRKRG